MSTQATTTRQAVEHIILFILLLFLISHASALAQQPERAGMISHGQRSKPDPNEVFSNTWESASTDIRPFRVYGTNFVVFLANKVTTHDGLVKRAAIAVYTNLPPAVASRIRPPVSLTPDQILALRILRTMGPAFTTIEPCIRALTIALGDASGEVRVIAQGALGDIGPAASNSVPALIDCVDHPLQPANRGPSASATTDINAIWALGRIGPSAASATSSLKKVLAAGEGREKVYSAEALWRIGWHNSNVLVSLQATLTDSNRQARAEAAEALLNIGTNADCAVPALRSVLADSDARVRVNAARALIEIRPGDEKARDLLLETISPHSTSQYWLQIFAASSLLRYKPAPPDAVALLISALDGKDPAQQIQAAYTLSGARVETPRVILTVGEILTSSNNPKMVVSAIKIAAIVGPPAAELVSQLQKLAASEDLEIHKEASIALARIQDSDNKD